MAPSLDSVVVPSLLCAEENESVFGDQDEYGAVVEEFEGRWSDGHRRIQNQNRASVGDGGLPLPLQSEECVALMLEKECQHLPKGDYLKRIKGGDLDLGARKEAIDWIAKVHAHFGFGPLCAYLSINYVDRFLSAYELPSGKAWMTQLLAVACLSLAAKMEEPDVPFSLDLQVCEAKFVFESRAIQRMELLVLSTLSWRMQAVTPFSYIDYFLNQIYFGGTPPGSLIFQSIQLILSTTKGIDFLEFRPSEIAAAVAIAVMVETKTVDSEQAISALRKHVQKEKVMKCIQLIHDYSLVGGSVRGASATLLSVPQSPIGVLDASCFSYRSDDTTVGSCSNSSQNTSDAKRRKLN